jgi:hypothetical protein
MVHCKGTAVVLRGGFAKREGMESSFWSVMPDSIEQGVMFPTLLWAEDLPGGHSTPSGPQCPGEVLSHLTT